MSVDHKFSKNIVAFPASNGLTSVTLNIPNLIAPEDESGVAVYYNGQLLQRYTTGDTTSFAKFYYTLTNNNSAYVAAPTTVGIDTSCSATIVITANQDFVDPGYDNTAGGIPNVNFDITDVFYVYIYYTVVGAI